MPRVPRAPLDPVSSSPTQRPVRVSAPYARRAQGPRTDNADTLDAPKASLLKGAAAPLGLTPAKMSGSPAHQLESACGICPASAADVEVLTTSRDHPKRTAEQSAALKNHVVWWSQMAPKDPSVFSDLAARWIFVQHPWLTQSSTAARPTVSLARFIASLAKQSGVYTGTLLYALALLRRMHLPGSPQSTTADAPHRMFLAAVMLASKMTRDSSPKNKHWMKYARKALKLSWRTGDHNFGLKNLVVMEGQFLHTIGYMEHRMTAGEVDAVFKELGQLA